MLEYNNNILNSEEKIIYVDNLDVIENIPKILLQPNELLLTSYNYDMVKNYKAHKGTSYELFYVDNNSNIHQLTYFVNEGNGLYYTKDKNLKINIDNKTIKSNSNNELYIDNNEFTCAYNDIRKGVLTGENTLFYDHKLNNGGFIVASDGIIKISNGLLMSLYEIKNYYDKFDQLALKINKMAIKLDFTVDLFNVGDILYINSEGKYTKNADGNMPFMICVIASNTLSDNCARFIPINFNTSSDIFARNNNNLYYKKLFNSVPVYSDNLNMLTSSSSIATNTYGYIATDNSKWEDNFKNLFNYKEHYYANFYTIKSDIIWYVDPDTFHKEDMYSLDKKAIVTEIINIDKFNEKEVCPIIEIEFSDGFKGYYLLNFEYSSKNARFELIEGSVSTIYPIMLINELSTINSVGKLEKSSDQNSKIKYQASDVLINSTELINKYKIYLSGNNKESIKFENDNLDSIDYKILEKQLKNNTKTITTTNTVTKSKTIKDKVTSTTTDVTYKEVWEDIDESDMWETKYVTNPDGTKEYVTSRKSETKKKTLVPVYNTTTTTNYVDRIEYYDETTTEYSYETIYTYKLIIAPGICDREKVYLKIQLGDSDTDLSDYMYLYFNNSEGIEYVFTQYQSSVSTGYMKIIAYASSEYYDKNPIDLGIIAVNGYQDSFKCVYLSVAKFSFSFNLENIIPVKAKVYKNYTVLTLIEDAIILDSNNYDDFLEAYEYTLDLNYSTTIVEKEYVEPILSETTNEIVKGETVKEIKESNKTPKEIITNTEYNVTSKSNDNIVKKKTEDNSSNAISVGNSMTEEEKTTFTYMEQYNKKNVVVNPITVTYTDIYINKTTYMTTDHVLYKGVAYTSTTCPLMNHKKLAIIDGNQLTGEGITYFNNAKKWHSHNIKLLGTNKSEKYDLVYYNNTYFYKTPNVIVSVEKPRIIPGGITIPINNKSIQPFVNNIYHVTLELRNSTDKSTLNTFKFKKVDNKLVLNEDIPVSNIENINKISIKNIEDNNGNSIPVKFRESGNLINKVTDWHDLNTITIT